MPLEIRRWLDFVEEAPAPGGEPPLRKVAAVAVLANPFAGRHVRDLKPLIDAGAATGGGKAWISSMTKRGGPGAQGDIPMNHKDALYVRSFYDGMTLTLHDAPQADEIARILCMADRGRISARVGGLRPEEVKGLDGLY
jgi:hypothetical protein